MLRVYKRKFGMRFAHYTILPVVQASRAASTPRTAASAKRFLRKDAAAPLFFTPTMPKGAATITVLDDEVFWGADKRSRLKRSSRSCFLLIFWTSSLASLLLGHCLRACAMCNVVLSRAHYMYRRRLHSGFSLQSRLGRAATRCYSIPATS